MEEFDISLFGKVGGALLGIYYIWKYGIQPIIRFFKKINNISNQISESLPVLLQICEDFGENGGEKLKDVVHELRGDIAFGKQRSRSILAFLDLIFFEAGKSGEITYISRKYSQVTGLLFEDMKGNGWVNSVKISERENLKESYEIAIIENREFDMEYTIVNQDNKEIKVRCHAKPVRCKKDILIGYIGILTILDK